MPAPTFINDFHNKYLFLSNFFLAPVTFEGITYPSTEHAFQATKSLDQAVRHFVAEAHDPAHAKRLGRELILRPDWEQVKDDVMAQLLAIKFSEPSLAARLIDTGDATLVEGNHWHDQYWGNCICARHRNTPGTNRLGELLMQLRTRLQVAPATPVSPTTQRVYALIHHMPSERTIVLGIFSDATAAKTSPEAQAAIPVTVRKAWEDIYDGEARSGTIAQSADDDDLASTEYLYVVPYDLQ